MRQARLSLFALRFAGLLLVEKEGTITVHKCKSSALLRGLKNLDPFVTSRDPLRHSYCNARGTSIVPAEDRDRDLRDRDRDRRDQLGPSLMKRVT